MNKRGACIAVRSREGAKLLYGLEVDFDLVKSSW